MNILLVVAIMAAGNWHPIEEGWYSRADSKAAGSGTSAYNMSLGETSVRCLCEKGFYVWDISHTEFIVIKAPKGYSDTIGRRFFKKPTDCLNCAD